MGTCLYGHVEVRSSPTARWNHILSVNFWKDYPLMAALRKLPSHVEGAPEDTTVWVWDSGPLYQAWKKELVDRCYFVKGEDFVGLDFLALDKSRLTEQTKALQVALRYLFSEGCECRLVFVES